MKNIIFLILIALLVTCCDHGPDEEIFEGDLIINFQSDHDQLEGRKIIHVTGDLRIERESQSNDATDIVDLSNLNCIRKVDGDLIVSQMNNLTSLSFLQNLVHVGGQLGLYSNHNIEQIDDLSALESVGSLAIVRSLALTSVDALKNIDIIDGGLIFTSNYLISKFPVFSNIDVLNGDLWIENNTGLESLSGLVGLEKIGGGLRILYEQGSLENLTGLENLVEIGKSAFIGHNGVAGNQRLLTLQGLQGLRRIEGDLLINECHKLANLNELESLMYVGGELNLNSNKQIQSLEGLQNLTYSNSINIARNTLLDDFCSIKQLVQLNVFEQNEYLVFLNRVNPTKDQILTECD